VPTRRKLPNSENASLQDLDVAIKCAPTMRSSHRLTAMKALIMGFDFGAVARLYNVDERTMQRWVSAYNRQGIDGLIEKARSGRPRKITKGKAAEIVDLVKHPEKAGQVHWTGRKIHGHLRRELELEVGYSTVMRFLKEQRFRLKVPQPWPDRQDEALRNAFCDKLKVLVADESIELWFGDESGIEGDPRPRRRWIPIGEKGRVTKNGDHLRMNVTGIVCPRSGRAFFCEFSHSDGDTF